MLNWLTRYQLEARLTLRMSAAGLITFALAQLLDLARDYWAVLTAVIVMQASVGGSLKAMVDRFLGTIGGAAWGGAVASALPHQRGHPRTEAGDLLSQWGVKLGGSGRQAGPSLKSAGDP